VNQGQAELLFSGLDKLLVIDGQVWMPLSMSAFNEGFIPAWDGGMEALDKAFAAGREVNFIMPENAWAVYPPAPLPAQGAALLRPGGGELARAAGRAIEQYIAREIQPLVQNVRRQITGGQEAGDPPLASLYHRLGILLVRAGQAADAKTAYEEAAGRGSVPAMTNRGNLALIEKDYAEAERWFTQALAREPENRTALQGLEKASAYGSVQ
jgi:tetratricopeptide (TPR) repeat protein